MKLNLVPAICLLSGLLSITSSSFAKSPHSNESSAIEVVSRYRAALSKKSVSDIEKTVADDLTVIEGTHVNVGWPDYRDNHIGPEMKEWKTFTMTESKNLRRIETSEQVVISDESIYRIETEKETIDLKALETYVLKRVKGQWKITLVHFSGKPIKPSVKQ